MGAVFTCHCGRKNIIFNDMKITGYLKSALLFIISLALFSCSGMNVREDVTEDSAGMITVPAGTFTMGSNLQSSDESAHEVYVDSFRIDKYEVPAKDFAEFLNAKGNAGGRYFSSERHSTIAGLPDADKKDPKYAPVKGFENHPANNVSWYGADAYCRWKGKRLPTEAEWEKAARGSDKREYPWGNELPDDLLARYQKSGDKAGPDVTVPVNTLGDGASFYGVRNMAGNVKEWVSDWYRENYCDYCDPAGMEYLKTAAEIICGSSNAVLPINPAGKDVPPITDPRGPRIGSFRVLRGGSWQDSQEKIRSAARFRLDPSDRSGNTGFRCADSMGRAEDVASAEDDLNAYIRCKEPEKPVVAVQPKRVVAVIEETHQEPVVQEIAEPKPVYQDFLFEDIFFDFDRFNIREDAQATVKAVIKWLNSHQTERILIEGHCDERGTNEYNLGLGERRAVATKNYLVNAGIKESRIEVISYGEEKPFCTEHDKKCWQSNRRSHFVVIKKN